MPNSTALQRLPSAKESKQGCLQLKPITITPTKNNEDECLTLPKSATVTIKVTGQTRSCKLGTADSVVIAAPLSHLYHSQLHLQVEFANSATYRGSLSVDELCIGTTATVSVNLQRTNALVVHGNNSNAAPRPSHTIALQLQCTLAGPCRSEVTKAHQALEAWLTVVDKVEDVVKDVWSKISPQIPNAAKKKEALLLVIPAIFSIMIPVVLTCLVISPVVIGFCLLFFPIMIPLVVGICLCVLATVAVTFAAITGVYMSSRYGRKQLQQWWQSQSTLQEYWTVLRGPRFGLQTFLYATGPRPTPVTLTRTQMPKEKWRRLGVSLTIDGVGSFSYLLPFVGEAFDVVWAPAQTVLIMALYQHVSPNMSYVSFAEEMLPFLDVLPSATTGWLMEFGPELWEEAKGMVENPKQLQMILFGSGASSSDATGTTPLPHSSVASRRPLPTGRPSRH